MATISDTLANQIQQAFDRYYLDTGNQNNFFFGAGDITLTKPDANASTVKVASYAKMTAELADHATTLGNHATTLGKVGRTDQTNTWTQGQTFTQEITVNRNVITKASLVGANIELFSTSPFIDFHYGNSTADYTHRIIADSADRLSVEAEFRVAKGLWVQHATVSDGGFHTGNMQGFVGELTAVPQGSAPAAGQPDVILQAPHWRSGFPTGRGNDTNGNAHGAIWFEENVGKHHCIAFELSGFSQAAQYWQMLSDGRIWNSTRGDVSFAGTSDRRLKHDIRPTDGLQSLANIEAMELVTFAFNDDEQNRQRRGVIAQQLQDVDPLYVKVSRGSYLVPAVRDENDHIVEPERVVTVEKLVLDTNPLLMDALAAIQVLAKRVTALENTQTQITEVA